MAVIPMQETTVYGMFAAAILGWFAFFGVMIFIKSKIPEAVVKLDPFLFHNHHSDGKTG